MLPWTADPAEHARLDLQHLMLKTKLNGLFVPLLPVRRALAPRQSTTPSILDLGTGSGSWAIDMAKLFPHADVVGLDLVPANLNSEPPLNCRFECDDINLGLLHYRNAFDVVHARCIALGIADYQKFLGEVIEVLRPGGVYLAGAGDMQLYNEDRSPVILPDDEEDPSQKSNINFHQHIGRWIREKGDAWDDTGEKVYWVALGPWEEDGTNQEPKLIHLRKISSWEGSKGFGVDAPELLGTFAIGSTSYLVSWVLRIIC
ncbi:hypothetical protein FRC04_005088 [Tulasnella sp. 424]|nr:hypothetical protein FRC04_005088 [Tulasnella sp. 424]